VYHGASQPQAIRVDSADRNQPGLLRDLANVDEGGKLDANGSGQRRALRNHSRSTRRPSISTHRCTPTHLPGHLRHPTVRTYDLFPGRPRFPPISARPASPLQLEFPIPPP
jgi:hypothetical protein